MRTLRWQNTTGENRSIVFDVSLAGDGQDPLPYELKTVVNVVEPPPPPPRPPCGERRPMPEGWFFDTPGETHYTGTVCEDWRWEYFDGTLRHNAVITANVQIADPGAVRLFLATCGGLCQQRDEAVTDANGVASVTGPTARVPRERCRSG